MGYAIPADLEAAGEGLSYRIPGAASPAGFPPYWRESYFFVAHRPDAPGDVLVLTMASHPAHRVLDSYQMGLISGSHFFARQSRPWGDDDSGPTAVGPVSVQVVEPYQRWHLRVDCDDPGTRVGMDLTWTARTAPYLTRRGSQRVGGTTVWDQRQLFQSGWFDGHYCVDGVRTPVTRWWGQRDHSWGIRNHARCPMWMWLAVQLPDGMAGVWCWEHPDGTRCFTDGCWLPSDGRAARPVTGFRHELSWVDEEGRETGYGQSGARVAGLAGQVTLELAGAEPLIVSCRGTWAARYGRRGGGLHQMAVRTVDGRAGTAIFELTGYSHHRYFPRLSRPDPHRLLNQAAQHDAVQPDRVARGVDPVGGGQQRAHGGRHLKPGKPCAQAVVRPRAETEMVIVGTSQQESVGLGEPPLVAVSRAE